MTAAGDYPRDLIGYGATPPHPAWPNNARIAVQFVVNYEEGGEACILHGDTASEAFLSEVLGAKPIEAMRHMNMESVYEYGSRAGFWRLQRLFAERNLPFTCFGVAMALARNPEAVKAMLDAGHEIASHGYRWIDYQHIDEPTEAAHLRQAIDIHTAVTGTRPLGWYLGRCSPNTRRLVAEEGGFLYDADSYADDLPYWDTTFSRPQLIVPYTLEANDMRFANAPGFASGEDFYRYLKDSFDQLYEEGKTSPKMLSVGLHCRLAGRPGRARALPGFWTTWQNINIPGCAGALISRGIGLRQGLLFLERKRSKKNFTRKYIPLPHSTPNNMPAAVQQPRSRVWQ